MSRNAQNLTADDQAFLAWMDQVIEADRPTVPAQVDIRISDFLRPPSELAVEAGVRGVVIALLVAVVVGLGGVNLWSFEAFGTVVALVVAYGLVQLLRTDLALRKTE